jgi:hypothetical protein
MPLRTTVLVGVCGLLGATIVVGDLPGLGLSLACLALVFVALVSQTVDRPYDSFDRALLGMAAGLCVVPLLRDSPWLVAASVLGAAGLVAVPAARGRRWASVVLAPAAVGIAALAGLPWVARRLHRMRRVSPEAWSWGRAASVTVVLLVILGSLLGSADSIFGSWIDALVPDLTFDEEIVGRLFVGGLFAAGALGIAGALASTMRWEDLALTARTRPRREWLLPVVVTDVLLFVFLLLQAARLFPGSLDEVPLAPGETLADQAHEGFGQLVAVTVVIVALLGWAGMRCGSTAPERRALAYSGGALVGLGLLVVASALARLLNYEAAYGWTVLRLMAGMAELWLAVVLLLVAVSWWPRVARDLPRLVVASAGVFVLVTGVIGPDAFVARADVERFGDTGKIDTAYLATLSTDAVPALAELPPAVRSCALFGSEPDTYPTPPGTRALTFDAGLWGWNVSRARAHEIADDLFPAPTCIVPAG